MIKTRILVFLAVALAVSTFGFAQSTAQPSSEASPDMTQQQTQPTQPAQGTQPSANQSASQAAAAGGSAADAQQHQTLTGTISADGKTFTGNNTTYTISNPNSVKAYANRPVSVTYQADTNNSIHIDSVSLGRPQ